MMQHQSITLLRNVQISSRDISFSKRIVLLYSMETKMLLEYETLIKKINIKFNVLQKIGILLFSTKKMQVATDYYILLRILLIEIHCKVCIHVCSCLHRMQICRCLYKRRCLEKVYQPISRI